MINLFTKLKTALNKTSGKIGDSIERIFIKKKLDTATIEQLEDLLLSADVGMGVTTKIISELQKKKFNQEVTPEEIKEDLSNIIENILKKQNHEFILHPGHLNVILVCGVNGNGKTTSIGKLAALFGQSGKKVAIAACDTFRAAAVEQIAQWAERSGAKLYSGKEKSDPASVAHNAISLAAADGTDILFIDTAGRLHNHSNLMAELAKIMKVIKKIDNTAPHHCLLVIDGNTGQNAINQVKEFKEIANVSGVIITKLDGTAKAGAILNIVDSYQLPIFFIGVGESIDSLQEFDNKNFAKALIGL